jgi:hypothetical protein
MITKKLTGRTDGFNTAIIEKLFANGSTICTVQQIDIDKDGKETFVKQDTNIGFPADYFKFTKKELEILNPTPKNINTII